ncbi:unnamed protein product [Linum trigynum]|uniref:Uncharacterized protein n=1 Tax=Linum trigynum TaxID=586398 RepID=A0AAV2FDQ3_9ROSI
MSADAATGVASSGTLHFSAEVEGRPAITLVHNGASLNFVGKGFGATFKQEATRVRAFTVRAANGAELRCNPQHCGVSLRIQGLKGIVDLNVLPLQGFDVILGVPWLRSWVRL